MASKLGFEMKLYNNTGTTETPVWEVLDNVKDLSVDFTKGEADVTTRASGGWKAMRGTLKEFSAEFQMIYDTTDGSFDTIQGAFLENTALDLAFADGPIATIGTSYIRTNCEVFGFKRSESNEEAVKYDVTIKRTIGAPPTFITVAA